MSCTCRYMRGLFAHLSFFHVLTLLSILLSCRTRWAHIDCQYLGDDIEPSERGESEGREITENLNQKHEVERYITGVRTT